MKPHAFIILGLLCTPTQAGSRLSASYAISADIADSGGRRSTSANYTQDGGLGEIAGLSNVASPAETAKSGYVAQLFEATSLVVSASPATVNESSSRQLSASQALDDSTTLAVSASAVSWSVASGPIASIDGSGLATASTVYQDTAATVSGSFAGSAGSLGLTVLNVNSDDFGSYAGDGLPDDWQVQYFGTGNPFAAPSADPEGDGQTNLFEYTAGLVPTNPASRFTITIQAASGQPAQKQIVFSPRLTDRTYTVQFSIVLPTWNPLTGTSTSDAGQQRTVTDPTAAGSAKFYRVQITKP